MDEKAIKAHEAVAAAQAGLYDAIGFLIEHCKGEGMDRLATHAYAAKLLARGHVCKGAACNTCISHNTAFNMLWPEEAADD